MLLQSWCRARWQRVPDFLEVVERGRPPNARDVAGLAREREILLQRARALTVQWVLDRNLAARLGADGARSS